MHPDNIERLREIEEEWKKNYPDFEKRLKEKELEFHNELNKIIELEKRIS